MGRSGRGSLDVEMIEKEINREAMQDGLGEILVGVILLGLGAASINILFAAVYLIPLILSGRISEVFKRRFTYPRVGYVKLREEKAKSILPGVFLFELAVFASLAVVFFLVFGDPADPKVWSQWSPILFAMMLVGSYLYAHGKSGNGLYLIYAGLALASGVAFSLITFNGLSFPYLFGEWGPGVVMFFLVMGCVFLAVGLFSLAWFLWRHPKEAPGD